MKIRFEADAAGFQRIWDWMTATPLRPSGLFTPLLSSASDFRRNVRLTRGAVLARPQAIYVAAFSHPDDGMTFKLTFQGVGIIRLIK